MKTNKLLLYFIAPISILLYSCFGSLRKKSIPFYNVDWRIIEVDTNQTGFFKVGKDSNVGFQFRKSWAYDDFYLTNLDDKCLAAKSVKKRDFFDCLLRSYCNVVKENNYNYSVFIKAVKVEWIGGRNDRFYNKVCYDKYLQLLNWRSSGSINLKNDTLIMDMVTDVAGKNEYLKLKCIKVQE